MIAFAIYMWIGAAWLYIDSNCDLILSILLAPIWPIILIDRILR